MARVVTSDPMDGYRTCQRPRIADPEHGDQGAQDEDCPSYESKPCRVVREEVLWTYADNGAQIMAGFDVTSVERSTVRYLPADGNWACPDCGHDMSAFGLEPRVAYPHLSESHPDELRRRTLRQERTADKQLSAAERQAEALEKLVGQGDQAEVIRELQRQLADLNARLDEKPQPRPRKAPV